MRPKYEWKGYKDLTELNNRAEMMPKVNREAFWNVI